jgi:predicted O-methyltransferase YrrM
MVTNLDKINAYYRNDVILKNGDDLIKFISEEAGVNDTDYFNAKLLGNLRLQQIPEEYSQLLMFFKNTNIKNYLELGVALGGSFFLNSIFLQKTLAKSHCVDSLAYKDVPWVQQTYEKINSKVERLKEYFPDKEFKFFNSTTDDFFISNTQYYDCIFIDADHDYEGVIKDYRNSLKFINKGGYLIFHDISNDRTGVARCWKEVKEERAGSPIFEFCHETLKNCGIGIIKIK